LFSPVVATIRAGHIDGKHHGGPVPGGYCKAFPEKATPGFCPHKPLVEFLTCLSALPDKYFNLQKLNSKQPQAIPGL
jgi:hypothetical protein